MDNEIVVGVDGSDEAAHAAQHAFALGEQFGVPVTVLHVVSDRALGLTRSKAEATELRERRSELLAEIEQTAVTAVDSSMKLVDGSPAKAISEFAAERDAALIVLGRQGMGGIGKRLLGGVTEGVLQRSAVPVYVVPDSEAGPIAEYNRILVPTDGSENAAAAFEYGGEFAQLDEGTVDVLNVVDLQDAGGPFDAGGLTEEFIERLESTGEDAVEHGAKAVSEYVPRERVRTAVERTSSMDGAGAGIRAYVEDHEIDLVVLSSRGQSNLKRKLLGSVASGVLRTVDVPVVVIGQP